MEGFLVGEALQMNLEEGEWGFGPQKAKMGAKVLTIRPDGLFFHSGNFIKGELLG